RIRFGLRVKYLLEAAAFFAGIGFFRLFGADRASNIGGAIGRSLGRFTGMSRPATRDFANAYPDKSEPQPAAIAREMWEHLGRVLDEYADLDTIHSTGTNPRLELVGAEHVRKAFDSGKGVIMVSGHFANWEVMPFALRDGGGAGGTMVRPANN